LEKLSHPAQVPALPGRRTVKTEPLPGSLVTVTSVSLLIAVSG
jgi:hypothetical protein